MLCEKCGAYFGDSLTTFPVFCHKCDQHLYSKARALGIYEKALAASILDLKNRPFIPASLQSRIHSFFKTSELAMSDMVIPVPLSAQRLQERGFNQAEFIANSVGKFLDIHVDAFSLRRKVHTPLHRGGMDQKAREVTVEKAFETTRPRFVLGKRILLVDDILTSGSTASACARSLLASGATQVNVFTIARAAYR
jgi:ComF family protein